MSPGAPSDGAWTIAKLLTSMQTYLAGHGVAGARLDAEVLLSFVLKVDRIYLYTHFDRPITQGERDVLRGLARRRASREPIAYICGHKEFYSRSFSVDKAVLIPRPETEHIVEAVLRWAGARKDAPLRVLDIGTGSGALAVTLACELPASEVWATDISAEALIVAGRNAAAHGVEARVHLAQGDLFAALDAQAQAAPFDIIVSNPPYIAQGVAPSLGADIVRFEPPTALFGGGDGLDVLRGLCADVHHFAGPQSCVAIEMGYDQQRAVTQLLCAKPWDDVAVVHDLQGHPRVMMAYQGGRPKVQARSDDAPDDQRDDHGLHAADDMPTFDLDTATERERAL